MKYSNRDLYLVAVVMFWLALPTINWKFFVYAYIPLFYFGWFLAHVENYFEHFKAKSPSDSAEYPPLLGMFEK